MSLLKNIYPEQLLHLYKPRKGCFQYSLYIKQTFSISWTVISLVKVVSFTEGKLRFLSFEAHWAIYPFAVHFNFRSKDAQFLTKIFNAHPPFSRKFIFAILNVMLSLISLPISNSRYTSMCGVPAVTFVARYTKSVKIFLLKIKYSLSWEIRV